MINLRLSKALKAIDKKFIGCVMLASYKKPVNEILICTECGDYVLKFSYKNKYFSANYTFDFIQCTLPINIINIIQSDIEKRIKSV